MCLLLQTLIQLLNKGKESRNKYSAPKTTADGSATAVTENTKETKQMTNRVLAHGGGAGGGEGVGRGEDTKERVEDEPGSGNAKGVLNQEEKEAFEELKRKFKAFSRNPTSRTASVQSSNNNNRSNITNNNAVPQNGSYRRSFSEERDNLRIRSFSIGSSIGRRSSAGPTARTTSSDEKHRLNWSSLDHSYT